MAATSDAANVFITGETWHGQGTVRPCCTRAASAARDRSCGGLRLLPQRAGRQHPLLATQAHHQRGEASRGKFGGPATRAPCPDELASDAGAVKNCRWRAGGRVPPGGKAAVNWVQRLPRGGRHQSADIGDMVSRDVPHDLLYRLNAFASYIPPLRARLGDVPVLARHFLDVFSAKYQTGPARQRGTSWRCWTPTPGRATCASRQHREESRGAGPAIQRSSTPRICPRTSASTTRCPCSASPERGWERRWERGAGGGPGVPDLGAGRPEPSAWKTRRGP